jgi:hypothetical protein
MWHHIKVGGIFAVAVEPSWIVNWQHFYCHGVGAPIKLHQVFHRPDTKFTLKFSLGNILPWIVCAYLQSKCYTLGFFGISSRLDSTLNCMVVIFKQFATNYLLMYITYDHWKTIISTHLNSPKKLFQIQVLTSIIGGCYCRPSILCEITVVGEGFVLSTKTYLLYRWKRNELRRLTLAAMKPKTSWLCN